MIFSKAGCPDEGRVGRAWSSGMHTFTFTQHHRRVNSSSLSFPGYRLAGEIKGWVGRDYTAAILSGNEGEVAWFSSRDTKSQKKEQQRREESFRTSTTIAR